MKLSLKFSVAATKSWKVKPSLGGKQMSST
uniref:Uncharacterized protein n=1 Tax=Rhizophora mucronata TaxID=61149 RepID=A0A2P2QBB5_RHIMU